MPAVIGVQSATGQTQAQIDRTPDNCPICGRAIAPLEFGSAWAFGNGKWVTKAYRCPWDECSEMFIAKYERNAVQPGGGNVYSLLMCFPKTPQNRVFPQIIQKISADFCQIYGEANAAEQLGLKLISGPGYRKALEFLMKDYLCRIDPGSAETIKKAQLGPCIKGFVKSDKVVTVASRATWLGNDETHYVRKWETKDLHDLKKLIDLTVHWIELEESTKELLAEMPEPQKQTTAVALPPKP